MQYTKALTAICLSLTSFLCYAQEPQERIAYFGILEDGLAEAEQSGRPILLISAAPQCLGVSGIW